MFIVIQHNIHDPSKFQECAKEVLPLPKNLHVHQFLPAPDFKKAVCLYEAASVDELSKYLDAKLNKGYLRKLFFDAKMKKYVSNQGVIKEPSHS